MDTGNGFLSLSFLTLTLVFTRPWGAGLIHCFSGYPEEGDAGLFSLDLPRARLPVHLLSPSRLFCLPLSPLHWVP